MPHRKAQGLGRMIAPPRRPERTLAVALLAIVLFNQPLLRLFDLGASTTVAGLPVIYVYLFAAWGLVIALLAAALEVKARTPANVASSDFTPFGDSAGQSPTDNRDRAPRNPPTSSDPAER